MMFWTKLSRHGVQNANFWGLFWKTASITSVDGLWKKMSKSMFNVVNPDMIVDKYGADTLRMYEMFLGPVEQSKPWDTNGIDGVHRFIKKFWSLFYDRNDNYLVTDEPATKEELKSLHKLIKESDRRHRAILLQHKYQCLYDLCKRVVRNEVQQEGNPEPVYHRSGSLCSACMRRVVGDTGQCRLRMRCQVAGMQRKNTWWKIRSTIRFPSTEKARFNMEFPADAASDAIQTAVLADERSEKWMEGKSIVKVIVVPKKIVNIVVK